MSVLRTNVDFAKRILADRVGNDYVYGGNWNPFNLKVGTDCSGLVVDILDATINGTAMAWTRHGMSTESWRPIEVGQVGPFGTICVRSPADFPADAAVKIAIHHGPGGGANSHTWCEVDGVRGESNGSDGCVTGSKARDVNDTSYANDWHYLPGPISGAAAGPDLAQVLSQATGLTLDRAAEILPEVQDGLQASECTNVNRIAMWLAQVGHESDNFNATEEYDDGDGGATERWIYKGRTWIQLTWSSNYDGFSKWCFGRGLVPTATYFVDNPKLLAELKWAGLGAAWYWTVARPQINGLCDQRDLVGVTKAINGGTNGLDTPNGRRDRYNRALAVGDGLLQLLTDGDDDMFNDSDRELLRQIADIRRKSLSPFRWPFEGEVNTCVGFAWTADANTHIQLVEKLAVIYGDPQSIAMLLAVSRTNEKGRDEDSELALRVLNRVTDAGKALGEAWLAKNNVKVTA